MIALKDNPCGGNRLAHGIKLRFPTSPPQCHHLFFARDPGAALPVIAPFLCAGERQLLAQQIEQRGARIDGESMEPSIHAQTHGDDTTRLLKRRACFAQRGTAQTNAYLLTPITTPLPGAAWLLLSGLAAQRTAIDPAEPSGS